MPANNSPLAALGGYTKQEEFANALTHGLALVLAVAGLVLLVTFSVLADASPVVTASVAVFGAAMVVLYLASTLYHAIPNRKAKRYLQIFDHSAIYVLIAGSYTPFSLITIGGTAGTVLCAVVWTIAAFGVIFQPILLKKADWLNCVLYLALGWAIMPLIGDLIDALPTGGLALLAGGGIVYTVGVIFYLIDRIPFNHAIWHVFVLAGTALQFFSVFFYIVPPLSAGA